MVSAGSRLRMGFRTGPAASTAIADRLRFRAVKGQQVVIPLLGGGGC